ncbi:hypothetical protein Daesc_008312 [Daldinia eschscholtzii]|uniref:Ribosomal protein L19 n=1 Tax=Daldinia eschscholtzii TaxID=292717 RepID=A0AAX6MBG3_9PEZI
MITQSARRPLSSWKAVLRRTRQQRQQQMPQLFRAMATETTPTASASAPPPPPPSPPPAAVKPSLYTYHAQQTKRLDKSGARRALFSKANPDAAKPGDVLQVTTRRGGGEPFAGVCLSIRRAGVDSAILLRNHVAKVPVERWFKIFSPNIVGIEIVWRRPKRARRARLTYMRKPKHDMGNVDHLVEAWRRTRNVFTTKGRAKGNSASAKK